MLSSTYVDRRSLQDVPLWRSQKSGASVPAARKSSLIAAPTFSASTEKQAQAEPGDGSRDAGLLLDGRGATPPVIVLQQLNRVLRSKTFVQSEKLCRFLRFVVEHVLDGNQSCLKEYLVGVEVYDRKPPYDPSQDSIVRTEARRLRNKLKEYYGDEGREDPVYIYLRPGSYVPAFQSREDLVGSGPLVEPGCSFVQGSSIVMVVLPFRDISENTVSATFARSISDELAYALMLTSGCTVVSPSSVACHIAQGLDVIATMKKVGAQVAFEGSARAEGPKLRVTARIFDATGAQLWLKRIDTEIDGDRAFTVEEQIAGTLSAGLEFVRTPPPIERVFQADF